MNMTDHRYRRWMLRRIRRRFLASTTREINLIYLYTAPLEKGQTTPMEETKQELRELAYDLQDALDQITQVLASIDRMTLEPTTYEEEDPDADF